MTESEFKLRLDQLSSAQRTLFEAMERLTFFVIGIELAFIGSVLHYIPKEPQHEYRCWIVTAVALAGGAAFAGLLWKTAANENLYRRVESVRTALNGPPLDPSPSMANSASTHLDRFQAITYVAYVSLSIAWYVLTAAVAVRYLWVRMS